MRLAPDCRVTLRHALMEAVPIAVRNGHGRALSDHAAALDVIDYTSTRAVQISTGRYDWSLLSALRHMATGTAITQSTANDAIRHHRYARQLATKTPLDRLRPEDRNCLPSQQRFSARTRIAIRRAGGQRMTYHRNPADRARQVCVERLCAISLAWHLGGEAEYVPGLGYSACMILLHRVALDVAMVARLTGTLHERDHAIRVADFTVRDRSVPA
jgi:hypothetical protein